MAYKRTTGKHNAGVGIRDFYKSYKKYSKNPVDYKKYSEFLKEYNKTIMDKIIKEAFEFKMPFKLGYLRLQKRKLTPYIGEDGSLKTGHIPVDWKATLDYWRNKWPGLTDEEIKQIPNKKRLRYHNDHTDGKSARFYWDKRVSNVIHQSIYIFKACRTVKEEIASHLKKNNIIEYLE